LNFRNELAVIGEVIEVPSFAVAAGEKNTTITSNHSAVAAASNWDISFWENKQLVTIPNKISALTDHALDPNSCNERHPLAQQAH